MHEVDSACFPLFPTIRVYNSVSQIFNSIQSQASDIPIISQHQILLENKGFNQYSLPVILLDWYYSPQHFSNSHTSKLMQLRRSVEKVEQVHWYSLLLLLHWNFKLFYQYSFDSATTTRIFWNSLNSLKNLQKAKVSSRITIPRVLLIRVSSSIEWNNFVSTDSRFAYWTHLFVGTRF